MQDYGTRTCGSLIARPAYRCAYAGYACYLVVFGMRSEELDRQDARLNCKRAINR
jgi:hypothetical protein